MISTPAMSQEGVALVAVTTPQATPVGTRPQRWPRPHLRPLLAFSFPLTTAIYPQAPQDYQLQPTNSLGGMDTSRVQDVDPNITPHRNPTSDTVDWDTVEMRMLGTAYAPQYLA